MTESTTPVEDKGSEALGVLNFFGKPFVFAILIFVGVLTAYAMYLAEPGTKVSWFKIIEIEKALTPEVEMKQATSKLIDAFSHQRLSISVISPCAKYRMTGSGAQEEFNILEQDFSLIGFSVFVTKGNEGFKIPIPDLDDTKSNEMTSAYSHLKEVCRKHVQVN